MKPPTVKSALNVSYAAVAWSAVLATLSITAGIATSSTALVGTGADVAADLASSIVLIWRFRAELGGHPATTRLEHRAERVAAAALVVVAAGITWSAITRILAGEGAAPSTLSVTATVTALVVLPIFAFAKFRVAKAIDSPALRMDGHISLVGAAMAAITLLGLVLTTTLNATWADPAAAIGVAIAALGIGLDSLVLSNRAARRREP